MAISHATFFGDPWYVAYIFKIQYKGQSPATGFILLFVRGLKANCCKLMLISRSTII